MTIHFFTSCDKKLKYKVYSLNGKKRKLSKKGRVKGSAYIEFQPTSDDIIFRIIRNNFLVTIFKWLIVTVLEIFYGDCTPWRVNAYFEIKVNADASDDTEIIYFDTKKALQNSADDDTDGIKDGTGYPLICTSHPYEKTKRNKVLNFVLLVIGLCIIIFVLAFAIAYFVTH